MKQETLEEAADRYAEIYRCPATNNNEYCKHDIISAINFGAKWQAERMYSEEEPDYDKIKEALVEMRKIPMTFSPDERMYSEEDMKQFAEWLIKVNFNYTSNISDVFLIWEKQFKKK
jgi:pullulanase/glycogen debranching enzyme